MNTDRDSAIRVIRVICGSIPTSSTPSERWACGAASAWRAERRHPPGRGFLDGVPPLVPKLELGHEGELWEREGEIPEVGQRLHDVMLGLCDISAALRDIITGLREVWESFRVVMTALHEVRERLPDVRKRLHDIMER